MKRRKPGPKAEVGHLCDARAERMRRRSMRETEQLREAARALLAGRVDVFPPEVLR